MKDSEYILQSLLPAVDLSLAVFCKSGEVLAYTLWKELVPSKKPFRMPQLVEYTDDEPVLFRSNAIPGPETPFWKVSASLRFPATALLHGIHVRPSEMTAHLIGAPRIILDKRQINLL